MEERRSKGRKEREAGIKVKSRNGRNVARERKTSCKMRSGDTWQRKEGEECCKRKSTKGIKERRRNRKEKRNWKVSERRRKR